ncbi:uncharacterized protein [Mycetomoellerius zeteki]|uniref:uncharacterized protein n=1 Tax=Mycetomoellerius zeteki TaxID=64791 RepID=UPI00084E6A9A|nr:PREDICTED: uncharacterized protein LOC108731299 [Trachymyrmex zeteki]
MKSLIFLIITIAITLAMPTHYQYYGPPAPIGHDGRVMDTPEVAHAKAAHLAAVAEAVAKVPHSVASYTENQGYHGYANPVSVDHQMYHSGYGYHGPLAPLDHDGRVIDTPEVARAKAAHLAAYNHIASSTPVAHDHSQIYKPPVYSHDGYYDGDSSSPLSHDNREINGFMAGVTFHAIHQAKSNRPFVRRTTPDFLLDPPPGPWRSLLTTMMSVKEPANEVGRLYETDLGDASTSEERCIPSQIVLFAFCAIATATPVLDTPEVAQAKAAHLATQAYEAARNTIGYGWPGYGWSGYGWPALYASAIAYGAPIGADGRVIDTPEVAQAKAAHLAAHAQEAAKTIGLIPYGALAYATSPAFYAYAPLGPDGRVIDTPEVAQAKAAHLAAHAAAARNAV